MTLADVIAIALGLAFTYLLLSMMASTIKEWAAAKLQWRAKDLQNAIESMLSGNNAAGGGQAQQADGQPPPAGQPAAGANLAVRVYGHAMIAGLSVEATAPPSYVPARNFSLALLDTLCAGSQAPAFTAIENAVRLLPDGKLKQRLQVLANEAGGDLDSLKSQIDTWFDDTMDRLSGVYKRKAQFVLFFIGLGLAIMLNVDTLKIVSILQHNGQIRTALADEATTFEKDHPVTTPSTGAAAAGAPQVNSTEVEQAVAALPIPIGWTFCADGDAACPKNRWVVLGLVIAEGQTVWAFFSEFLGWLITGAAVSLGAPFWFDLLNQLVNLRSAGPKPPRADVAAPDTGT
jgi:hypothetical protein